MQLEKRTGIDPGSPVSVGMTLVPSDPAAFIAALTQMKASYAILAGLSYSVI